MATITPLRGVRYDPACVGDYRDVLAPPYDVISTAEQEALHARSPWNAVRLVLPREADRGAAAARTLREWLAEGVLRRDAAPALYHYAQTFPVPGGGTARREGIICRLRLEPFARGVVRPHERTLPGPKADRLAILRATGAHLSPIFGLSTLSGVRLRDLLGTAVAAPPTVDVTDSAGERHELWTVTAPDAIARVVAALAPATVIIADGHHRYETALAYCEEQNGAGASGTVLAFLANMAEEGLVILPTHRLVRRSRHVDAAALEAGLGGRFAVAPLPPGAARAPGEIDCLLPARALRLRALPGAAAALARLPAAVRGLDVALLHAAVLEPLLGLAPDAVAAALDFTHDDAAAARAVRSGRAAAAFCVTPPSLAQVRAVCLAGELMPEKSTYFYPKLADGLVYDLVGPAWM
jgi:uncharacterized protein (DUF1015 family)